MASTEGKPMNALEKRRMEAKEKAEQEALKEKAKLEEERKELERISMDPRRSDGTLKTWEPENPEFWKLWGWKIVLSDLLVSTYNLFLMFAIWKQWGGLVGSFNAAYKKDPTAYHFGFDNGADRKMAVGVLGGVAGLSGAVHRSIHGFLPELCGGRMANFMNNLVGLIAVFFASIAVSNADCNYWVLFLLAIMMGCGGGGFSSIMANISLLFPIRLQGTSLGLVGGFGNLGISCAQFFMFVFGAHGLCLADATGHCEAENIGGKYVYQVELIWTILLLISLPLTWFFMHDLPGTGYQPPPEAQKPRRNLWNAMRFLQVQAIIYVVAIIGAVIFQVFAPIVKETPTVAIVRGFVLAGVTAASTVVLLYGTTYVTSAAPQIQKTYGIFRTWENVLLSMLYIMTFSSFIGYAATFPKLMKAMFPDVTPTDFTWMPAFLGSFARAGGGFVSDRVTGAFSTAGVALVMTAMSFGLGFVIRAAMAAPDPHDQFALFAFLNAILFCATGMGNATVFRLIGALMPIELRAPMLGWTGAMAAYGGAIFPTFFDAGIAMGVNDLMYYLISGYYGICGLITWRYCFWVSPRP